MQKLQFGKHEIHRFDSLNIGLFEVMPEGTVARTKGKTVDKVSDDGRVLKHLGKYYGSYAAAARALHKMLAARHIEDPDVASVADALERAREEFRPVSEAIGAAAGKLEAAR